ncbi:MAG: LacI family transcriptional regulator [Blautia sp.]|nr:LacI family transcriptional regulator [Blautia sp.]MCM1201033.1 LacI family transcriptional regulator [Bacteroides fragilis]
MAEDKNLTINDIADALGVSKTTVSRAISGKGRIGAKTRSRVRQYIEEHHYTPNVIAKGLAQSRTYNIGLVIPGDYNIVELPFFQNCMLGISKIASSMDYDVLVSIVTADDISRLQRVVVNHKVDGFILTRTLVRDAPAAYLKETGIPFVAIGSTEDASAVWIDNDHQKACRELTGRLIGQGMERIALIGGSRNHMVNRYRVQGFEDACRQAGKKAVFSSGNYIFSDIEDMEAVEEIIGKLLEEKIQCIISTDDYLCGCVLNSLQQRKIRVPEQVKVASFYDSSFLENYTPSVTSIQFDIEELGKTTCKTLLAMIGGREVPHRSLLGYRISMRESTKGI